MTKDDYRQALKTARAEFDQLTAEIEAKEKRRAQLRQTIGGLALLCGDDPMEEYNAALVKGIQQLGLTDACRNVLRAEAKPLTPAEIKRKLEISGFPVDQYSNVLASIHTTLKRMEASGEIESVGSGSKKAYRRKLPPAFAPLPGGKE